MNCEINHIIKNTKIIEYPFYHLYIENVLEKDIFTENVFEKVLSLFSKFYEFPEDVLKNVSLQQNDNVSKDINNNIYTGIPSIFLYLVFHIHENDETILYDKNLIPVKTYFKKNSLCTFVPSLHSYHSFQNQNKVFFYTNYELYKKYEKNINLNNSKEKRIKIFKFNFLNKLQLFPLIEYKILSLNEKFIDSKINEENGKIIL